MTGVMCPQCGSISPTAARECPSCGTSLTPPERTRIATKRITGEVPVARRVTAEQAPVQTIIEDGGSEDVGSIAGGGSDDPSSTLPADDPSRTRPEDTLDSEIRDSQRVRRIAQPASSPLRPRRPTAETRPGIDGINQNPVEEVPAGKELALGRKLQEYVLEAKIGSGGMGVVYRAVHPMIGKRVAIKVLRPELADERDMQRLLDEARVVNSINHRGIINIFGAGALDDGRNYLIMELLEGESLEARLMRDGTIAPSDAVVILEQVLSALAAAHKAGIVHRDLKPANIFLVKDGDSDAFYVKLLDFGLARRKQEQVTRIAGTPDYISPEHARGRPAGPPADLYAFGVLCFHMLTGRLPFPGNTPMEVMEQHVHKQPPVPHEVSSYIPLALSELILKLLAKDPGERPDAQQVKADLKAATKELRNASTIIHIRPVADERESKRLRARERQLKRQAMWSGFKRWVVRHRLMLFVGAILLWMLGLVTYVMWPSAPKVVAPRSSTRVLPQQRPVAEPPKPGALPAPGNATPPAKTP